MSAPVTVRPRGFAVRLPESWVELDIWRATRTGDVPRLVAAQVAANPALAPYRGLAVRLIRDLARRAERAGAVFLATTVDGSVSDGVLTATIMAFYTQGPDDPDERTVERMAAQLTAVSPSSASPYWRRVEIVNLAAGRAVRVLGVEPADVDGRGTVDCVTMQTLIPLPDGGGVLNIACCSPQIALAEPMLDLFDAITGTLEWRS
ncbi:MAG: hypothetical protein IRY92_01105 [Dactylosporangium sp.]|nr:hypothetical protein [Dactylosporangium sp.]